MNCPISILRRIKRGSTQRLLKSSVDITSLVITYHPNIDIARVEKSVRNEDLSDFFTYCLVKKSARAAIEIVASGGMLVMFSSVSPYLCIRIRKIAREIERIQ